MSLTRCLCIISFLVSMIFLQSCSMNATMIPVEGPLSKLRPVPVLRVHVDGIQTNSGNIRFSMPDGDACTGRWSSAAGAGITLSSGSLISQYGSIYASGVSVSPGRGQNPGRALATCVKGSTFELEFVTGAGTAHGFGIGKDTASNIYKFIF